jgi:hypothetical protein
MDNIEQWLKKHNLFDAMNSFIKRPDSLSRFTSAILGWTWEQDFQRLCGLNGIKCVACGKLDSRYDLIANGYRIQCKHTSKWPIIDIRNKDKNNNRRYLVGDFDFIAIRSLNKVFIIPQDKLPKDSTKVISGYVNLDTQKYRVYLDNFADLKY